MILHLLCVLETVAENAAWCIIFSSQMVVLFWERKTLQCSATLEGNLNPHLKIKMVVDFAFLISTVVEPLVVLHTFLTDVTRYPAEVT